MAALTIFGIDSCMVKACRFPGFGAVTERALAVVMVFRTFGQVTGLAVFGQVEGMVELHFLPGGRNVASGAVNLKMRYRRDILMTRHTQ